MSETRALRLIDTHAGGDVSRIVVGGVGPLPGATVREQMEYLQAEADGLRRLLLSEPYGAPEMSVDLIVPATDPDAEAGYIIMEVMGYPIYSGSNTLCTATALLDSGIVGKREGLQRFTLESPAGLVRIEARVSEGVVETVTCEGLPSYIDTHRASVHVPSIGRVTYSIAYSGGFYGLIDAAELGFALTRDEESRLAAAGHAIVEAIRAERSFAHHSLGDIGPLPFLHFMGPVERVADDLHRSRSATYVHPDVVCRSTTGTGTSARLALLDHEDRIRPGERLETVSLRDTRFVGRLTATHEADGRTMVENTITGRGYVLARSELVVNCDDPLVDCTGLRPIVADEPAPCR